MNVLVRKGISVDNTHNKYKFSYWLSALVYMLTTTTHWSCFSPLYHLTAGWWQDELGAPPCTVRWVSHTAGRPLRHRATGQRTASLGLTVGGSGELGLASSPHTEWESDISWGSAHLWSERVRVSFSGAQLCSGGDPSWLGQSEKLTLDQSWSKKVTSARVRRKVVDQLVRLTEGNKGFISTW